MLIEARKERPAWRKLKSYYKPKRTQRAEYLEALSTEANSVPDLGYQKTIPVLQWLLQLSRDQSMLYVCLRKQANSKYELFLRKSFYPIRYFVLLFSRASKIQGFFLRKLISVEHVKGNPFLSSYPPFIPPSLSAFLSPPILPPPPPLLLSIRNLQLTLPL